MLSLRTLRTKQYIYRDDPAVDAEKSDWKAYERDGDIKHIAIRDGFAPTVFTLRRLTRRQYLHATERPAMGEKIAEAVAYGLKGWTNFDTDLSPSFKQTDMGERLVDDVLEALFAPELFVALGLEVISMSTLSPPSGQG